MTFFMAVTAALALSASPLHASAVPDIRVIRAVPGRPLPHDVRLRYDTVLDGIRGTDEFLVDLRTRRFVERDDVGPASTRIGFDGVRTWSADATGLAEIEDASDDRSATLAWSYLLAGAPPGSRAEPVPARGAAAMRVSSPALSRGFDVAADARTGRVREAVVYAGGLGARATFADYARHGDLIVPSRLRTTSIYDGEAERLRSVEVLTSVPAGAFSRPVAPRDAFVAGVTRVALESRWYGPAVVVRIDGGPPLRMLLDTGSTFALAPETARRAHLRQTGTAKTGGVGPHAVPERYATVRRLRIGGAELRDQPVEVFALGFEGLDHAPDGIIGYELFARFAARLDFKRGVLELARDVALLRPRGARVPFVLAGTQPAVPGSIDGLRGSIGIDTGSMAALDVNAPAVREHRLLAKYGATSANWSNGIGGALKSYDARAGTVRLGDLVLHDVPAQLDVTTAGAMNDPTLLGNAGIPLLKRFVVVLDYRGRAMYLEPVR